MKWEGFSVPLNTGPDDCCISIECVYLYFLWNLIMDGDKLIRWLLER